MKYSKQDIINSFKSLGINKDDVVFFSTSLGMVGLPPKEIKNQDDLNKLFLEAINEVMPDGSIIVPTYSYTFGKSISSNLANFTKDTKAEIGSFPNFILKQRGVIRSIDPFVSVACLGKKCEELLSNLSNISYGKGSLFEKLVNLENAKCCSIGLGTNWTPFIHYADYLAKVPHRYDKLFWGEINGIKTPWIYSVRFAGDESYPYAYIAGKEAEKIGIWRYENIGRARIYLATCKEYFNFVMDKLKQNPWYLAKGPAIDVIEKEKQRISYINDGDFVTGKWVDNFLVPERWDYKEAFLIGEDNKIYSTTPWIHSLSIDKELSFKELQSHISYHQKNVFYNRDFGFLVKNSLPKQNYRLIIKSEFGKGTIDIKKGFAFVEEWIDISKYNQPLKKVFKKGYFE